MKSMKKILALVLALILLVIIPVEAVAATIEDDIAYLYAYAEAVAEDAETARAAANVAAKTAESMATAAANYAAIAEATGDPAMKATAEATAAAAEAAKAAAAEAAAKATMKATAAVAAKAAADAAAKAAVGTGFKVDGVQHWFAPEGGTVTNFIRPLWADEDYELPINIIYLSAELSDSLVDSLAKEDLLDFVKDNWDDMSTVGISAAIAKSFGYKVLPTAISVIGALALWALDQTEKDIIIDAHHATKEGKIYLVNMYSPARGQFILYGSWEGNSVSEGMFGEWCKEGTERKFLPGQYDGKENDYK